MNNDLIGLPEVGFIISRYVNSPTTNLYWQECYDCIRKYYSENKIIIIDDNSNYNFITKKNVTNCTIIKSEFPQRGEILPYYYYLSNKQFDIAMIIHDSVFINQPIDFTIDKYMILWDFEHIWNNVYDETRIIKSLSNNSVLLDFYKRTHLWKGCFGSMSIITYDYLKELDTRYNISKLLNVITNRKERMALERVIACILQSGSMKQASKFGTIHQYTKWGGTYDNYIKTKDKIKLPLIKVWSGR